MWYEAPYKLREFWSKISSKKSKNSLEKIDIKCYNGIGECNKYIRTSCKPGLCRACNAILFCEYCVDSWIQE